MTYFWNKRGIESLQERFLFYRKPLEDGTTGGDFYGWDKVQ